MTKFRTLSKFFNFGQCQLTFLKTEIIIFSIFFFVVLTTFWVFTEKENVFFLIYIFWWDEFIKTLSGLYIRIRHREQIENLPSYNILLSTRFFMLFVYFIFIVIIFGIGLAFSSKNFENNSITFEVLLFGNWIQSEPALHHFQRNFQLHNERFINQYYRGISFILS